MSAVDAALERFARLHPRKIDLSLDRIERLLVDLGSPHKRLPPVVHVAGTNGKGSTIAFMRAALEAAGKRVHVYTSPHLVRFNERIRLAGALVDDERLADALARCEAINAGQPISVFEMITAAAFALFSESPADYLLLEVGLGGRYDATNVIDRPAATVITPVSIDHTEFLGPTIEQIAFEKAGVLRRGAPAIVAEQDERALAVIEREALKVGASRRLFGRDFFIRAENGRLAYEDGDGLVDLPPPRLAGRHQRGNAATAVATLRAVEPRFPTRALEQGLIAVEWPARLQRLSQGALARLMPADGELWLDGGHNAAGGEALAAVAKSWQDRRLNLVFGMLNTHDAKGFLSALAPYVARVEAITIPGEENARPAAEIAATAAALGLAAAPHTEIAEAVAGAAAPGARVLICGSLYLAGRVLAANDAQR